MAKKKEMNYQELDVEELAREREKLNHDLFKLKFRAASAPVKNVMQVRAIRRDVARINTFMNQKRRQAT